MAKWLLGPVERIESVGINFVSEVYFTRGTLPAKRVKGHLAGGPKIVTLVSVDLQLGYNQGYYPFKM